VTVGLGFDPGIASPGIGVVRRLARGYALVSVAVPRTLPSAGFETRCDVIVDALTQAIREHAPAFVAFEDQTRVKTAAWLKGEINHASSFSPLIVQGLALACARIYRVPVIKIQPMSAKLAVLGKGNRAASKREVQEAVFRLTGTRASQDGADAIAVAVAGFQRWTRRRAA
jgi:Holliday junction resolvasome RuvABC endonuclease subunit